MSSRICSCRRVRSVCVALPRLALFFVAILLGAACHFVDADVAIHIAEVVFLQPATEDGVDDGVYAECVCVAEDQNT